MKKRFLLSLFCVSVLVAGISAQNTDEDDVVKITSGADLEKAVGINDR